MKFQASFKTEEKNSDTMQKLNQKINRNLGSNISPAISAQTQYCGEIFIETINALKLNITLRFVLKKHNIGCNIDIALDI